MIRTSAILTAALLLAAAATTATATTYTTSFEGLWPYMTLNNQIPGFTFSDDSPMYTITTLPDTVYPAFPPHSGTSAAYSWSNLSRITFNNPVATFSGYFTNDSPTIAQLQSVLNANGAPADQTFFVTGTGDILNGSPGVLSITAFDQNGLPVAQVFDSTSDRNVFLELQPGVSFNSVVIDAPNVCSATGGVDGLGGCLYGDFTMDDLTIVEAAADPTVTPEPAMFALMGLGLVAVFFSTRIAKRIRKNRSLIA